MLQLEEERTSPTQIKVVGVGGGGMNAVNRMIDASLSGVEFLVINTDEQVLKSSEADLRIAIGSKTTRGMGAGGNPEIGTKAAQEDRDRISQALKGADMVFITAGMGGGTGTGAAPVVAEVARSMGALTVGVVTLPFLMEGGKRMQNALRGLEELKQRVDTCITIKNDSIFKVIDRNTSVDVAFRVVDDVLLNAVKGISDLINTAGLVNVDFADVRSIMDETGDAIMGAGEGLGDNRIADAVNQAINNALLEDTSIEGATALLINVCGGQDMSITEWKEVSELITTHVDPQANIIIGLTLDPSLQERIRVTVIATGFRKRKSSDRGREKQAAGGSHWRNYADDAVEVEKETVMRKPMVSMRQFEAVPGSFDEPAVRQTDSINHSYEPTSNIEREESDYHDSGYQERPFTHRPYGQEPAARPDYSYADVRSRQEFPVNYQGREMPFPGAADSGDRSQNSRITPEQELPPRLTKSRKKAEDIDYDDLEIPAYLRRKNQ